MTSNRPTPNPLALDLKAADERRYHDRRMTRADFDQAPFTITWEVTQACAFACCRKIKF